MIAAGGLRELRGVDAAGDDGAVVVAVAADDVPGAVPAAAGRAEVLEVGPGVIVKVLDRDLRGGPEGRERERDQ